MDYELNLLSTRFKRKELNNSASFPAFFCLHGEEVITSKVLFLLNILKLTQTKLRVIELYIQLENATDAILHQGFLIHCIFMKQILKSSILLHHSLYQLFSLQTMSRPVVLE